MFPVFVVLAAGSFVGCLVGAIEGKANGKRIFNESLANVRKKELGSWEENGKSVVIRRSMSNPQSQSNLNSEYMELLNSVKNL